MASWRSLWRTKDLVSLPNVMAGTLAAWWAADGRASWALGALGVALLSDFFDGIVARRTTGPTPFGKALDMADLVSFGLAPVLVARAVWGPAWPIAAAGVAVVAAALLRLARHQATPDVPHFTGLPSFATVPLVAGLAWVDAPMWVAAAALAACAPLMLASFRIPRSVGWGRADVH